jgi:acid phosphatase type 7
MVGVLRGTRQSLEPSLCQTSSFVSSLRNPQCLHQVVSAEITTSSMLRSLTVLALGTAVVMAQSAAIDDSACDWKLSKFRCEPNALCSYQYKFGDLTPNQSCRVRPKANRLPQQIHLAYAGETAGTGMTISWATFDHVTDSTVWIGTTADSLAHCTSVQVTSRSYYSEGKYTLFQNHATVTGLSPNTKYFYKVGSASDATIVSSVESFTTARSASDPTPFDIGVYGDLGFGDKGEASAGYINTLGDTLSFIYHIGDIGYADDDFLVPSQSLGFFYEEVYNKWMNSLTPVMSKIPYMVTVGNHEAECHSPACLVSPYKKDRLGNYTAYNARFKMPSAESKGVQNMWYSFEYGPIHMTTVSSETDYQDAPANAYTGTNKNGNFGNQLAWLEADLQKAHANRGNVPWLIVGMHRPIYHRLDADASHKPTGDSLALQKSFEALFIKYGVDLVVAGHEHSYERHYPIADGVAMKDGVSADNNTYANPKAPVYIVTGGPGNPEKNALSGKNGVIPWSVLESAEYGINTIRVTRNTLTLKYVTTSDQKVVDEFVICKN